MQKNKIILGFLAIAFGLLVTACGSDDPAPIIAPAPVEDPSGGDDTKLPGDFDDINGSCTDCIRTFNGTFRIANDSLFLEAYGYDTGNSIIQIGNDSFLGLLLGDVVTNVGNSFAQEIQCQTQISLFNITTDFMNELFNRNDDFREFECTSTIEPFSTGSDNFDYDIASSYDARLRARFNNSEVDALELAINADFGEGVEPITFFRRDDNVFVNNDNTLMLVNDNGRILLVLAQDSQLIGEFRD